MGCRGMTDILEGYLVVVFPYIQGSGGSNLYAKNML